MARLTEVDDPADERLADYAALTDARLRKRYEHQAGVLIAEGPAPVRALVASPYPVRSLLLAHERVDPMADVLSAVDAPAYVVDRSVLAEVVRFPLHQGVIACGGRLPPREVADVVADARRLLVLEGLNDHENLGTLFRSGHALGVDGVILGPGCADPLYRRSVRVSMGHVLHVPHAVATDMGAMIALLRSADVMAVAFTPRDDAEDLGSLASRAPERVALMLGAEGPGLSDDALAAADVRVRIPMRPDVDSINVAAAGAIALYALGWGTG